MEKLFLATCNKYKESDQTNPSAERNYIHSIFYKTFLTNEHFSINSSDNKIVLHLCVNNAIFEFTSKFE